jgi:hypothetical protein
MKAMEGFLTLLRPWLRPHRDISQEKPSLYLGFLEFVHDTHQSGKALLSALSGIGSSLTHWKSVTVLGMSDLRKT